VRLQRIKSQLHRCVRGRSERRRRQRARGATPGTTSSGAGVSEWTIARRRISWSTASFCMSAYRMSASWAFAFVY
jgi:hypothetical protein